MLVLLFVAFTRRFVLCLTLCYFVLMVFFSPLSIAIPSTGEERATLSAFCTFVRFVLVWFCWFLFLLVSGKAAVCNCDTPWTFLLSVCFGCSHNAFINHITCKHEKKVREKSRKCHNHKPQPFPDPKRKRKPTNLNNTNRTNVRKSTKMSSLFPKRGNRNTKRTEKHKNKMTHGKTYNKSPRRISHKATRSKSNTGTTALERSVEQATGGFKALFTAS